MPRGPVSVQLYSVRTAISADLEATLERIAGLGFTRTEPYGFVDQADRYRSALKAAGLTAPSAHAPILQLDDPSAAFAAASAIGVRTIIDPMHAPEEWATEAGVARIAERMNRAAERAAAAGLAFGYHNHEFELQARPGGRPALELLVPQLDPAVVIELDTYWAEVGGVDAAALLGRLGSRVQLIHVKDGPKTLDVMQQLPAGQGAMDVPAVLAAAPAAVRVLEFDDYDGDVFDGLAASLAAVTAMDAEAAPA